VRGSERALLRRIDRNLLHLAHPSLSQSVCAAVGIGELREALEEALEGGAEPLLCHSDLEGELTQRLHSPPLARAIVSLADDDSVTLESVSRALGSVTVVIARALRTRLFLRPRRGGGGEGGGGVVGGAGLADEGGVLDVSAEDGADVLYFVDVGKGRILLSDDLPPAIDVYGVLANAINQLLRGKLAHELLSLSVALHAEPGHVTDSLARLGVSVERSQYDAALARRGLPGAELLPLDAALVSLQPHRRFVTGEVVAWADEARLVRYGLVVDAGGDESNSRQAAIKRLQIRVSATEVRALLSSDVMCFKTTAGGHTDSAYSLDPPAPSMASSENAHQHRRGGESSAHVPSEQAGQAGLRAWPEDGGAARRGDAVSAQELAGAVERMLSRLDVPLSLEKKELLQSVLELRERVDSG
jgi:hypothetical protein